MSGRASELPWWADAIIIPALNLALAFFVSALLLLALGESPLECTGILLTGAFGSGEGIGYTLFYATNFIFTGIAFAVAFQAGLFNIGVEGQAYIAGLGVALASLYFEHLPQPLIILLAIVFSAAFGAAWAFVPAYLQAKRGSHLVITTIMFNYIAQSLMIFLLNDVLRPADDMTPETRIFAPSATLPHITNLFGLDASQSPLNLAFIWALIVAAGYSVLIGRTRLGYELRTLGSSPGAASYAGMDVTRLTITALMISGGIGGFLALNEVMGAQDRVRESFTGGYGFVGIAVALMGRNRSIGIILASILFGALYQGGAELAFDKPKISRDMIVVIQGLVVLFAGALEHLFRRPVATLLARRTTSPPI